MKDTRAAKSRLGGTPGDRRQLAIVMARDTLCAVVNADAVEQVLVICERPEDIESFSLPGVEVLARPGLDLNAAIQAGAAVLRAADAQVSLASLPGDLPYLRSTELDVALARAATHPRCCIGDRDRIGTTLLTARAELDLDPRYGEGSLLAHHDSGAVELGMPAWSGLRRDVDVPEDLTASVALGARTKALFERRAAVPAVGVGA